jgi:hypothetical protein
MKHIDGTPSFKAAFANLARAVPLAVAAMLPITAAAQVLDCPATFNANTAEDILYFVNEPVGIELEFGVGTISGGNYLEIDQFTYYLDCQPGEVFPNCTSAGNTVEFIGNVVSDCTDEDGEPITFDAQEAGGVVTFVPQNPPSETIRIPANNSCSVTFDVMVTGVSGDNEEKEIFELTGFVDSDAQCDNEVTAGLGSQVIFSLSAARTVFWVTKDFSDDNPLPVDVHLVCDTGLPLIQEFTITDPAVGGQWPIVGFVVRDYEFGELGCHVFEDPIPGGYTPSYTAGAIDGIGDVSDDGEGCYFENVVNGAFTCQITDNADPGEFTVTKYWVIDGAVGHEVLEEAWVEITCDSTILSVDGLPLQYQTSSVSAYLSGDGDSVTVGVDSTGGPAHCSASEQTNQSGVESTDDCGVREIPAGGSSSCSITNTVFFEGIPTLNPYGMAALVLLMLGVGFVGLRRFV